MDKLSDKDIKALFELPPSDAIAHLKAKGLHIGWDYQDTHAIAHARSFTIAKMTSLELLSTTKKAIEQAMGDGAGYKGFEQSIKPELQKQGWWGKKVATNPQGRDELVQLGSVRRLKTIYHTNRRTAVMTARYAAMKEVSDTHPYWQYSAVLDSRTRASHAARHGVVYRHDDPFWAHSFPPNGYGCRCTVKAVRESMVDTVSVSDANTQSLADDGFFPAPLASHLFDKLWYDKAKAVFGQPKALSVIAQDMADPVRVAGFLAWVRQSQKTGYAQGRTYGVGVLSEQSLEKIAADKMLNADELSPVVGFRDKVIVGRKNTRHTAHHDALDEAALEKIIADFGKPDWELWDTQNDTLLLVYKMPDKKVVKLTVQHNNQGLEVISGFYQDLEIIESAIKGKEFVDVHKSKNTKPGGR